MFRTFTHDDAYNLSNNRNLKNTAKRLYNAVAMPLALSLGIAPIPRKMMRAGSALIADTTRTKKHGRKPCIWLALCLMTSVVS